MKEEVRELTPSPCGPPKSWPGTPVRLYSSKIIKIWYKVTHIHINTCRRNHIRLIRRKCTGVQGIFPEVHGIFPRVPGIFPGVPYMTLYGPFGIP